MDMMKYSCNSQLVVLFRRAGLYSCMVAQAIKKFTSSKLKCKNRPTYVITVALQLGIDIVVDCLS